MKNLLKTEEAAMFLLSIAGLYILKSPWWCYILLLLGPDISMLGYLGGNSIGAFFYNLFHHKGTAVLFLAAGWYFSSDILLVAGIILFGHSGMDRMLGYGLKYGTGFTDTHLGKIGKKQI